MTNPARAAYATRVVAFLEAQRRDVLAPAYRQAIEGAPRRRGPLFAAVHGPQGAGKSTLCAAVVAELTARGKKAVTISIDDFYLTHAEQRALAAAHPGNRYLEHRGYPGTHDVDLGVRVLAALASGEPGEVALPLYDKSAHGGRGERRPPADWPRVATPLDFVLLEGWMVAFVEVAAEAVPEPELRAPNAALAAYAAWRRRLDVLILLEVAGGDLEQVVRWRVDAERARRAAGAPGLSDAEALDYVRRFLPAYRLWQPALRPGDWRAVLRVALGADRLPVSPE